MRPHKSLIAYGADEVIVDERGKLADTAPQADKVLELVGARTLTDSLKLLAPGGICCHTGVLGGAEALDGFNPIKDIPNGRYLTGYFSNYPTQASMDAVFGLVATHGIQPRVAATFDLDHLPDAMRLQNEGGFQGKIVVTSAG